MLECLHIKWILYMDLKERPNVMKSFYYIICNLIIIINFSCLFQYTIKLIPTRTITTITTTIKMKEGKRRMNTKKVQKLIRQESTEKRRPRKILIIGSSQSGKSSLIRRFLNNAFSMQYLPSSDGLYNEDYSYRGYNFNVDIVDLPGSVKSNMIRDLHIQTADVIMLVYEIDNLDSVNEVRRTFNVIKSTRQDKMPIVLVGTKSDLKRGSTPPEFWQQSEEVIDILNEIHGTKHILTSSKYNIHVKEAFEYCFDDIIKRIHTISMSQQPLSTSAGKKRKSCRMASCLNLLKGFTRDVK